jgi:hypothetical protein
MLLLILFLQPQEKEDPTLLSLRYLARHQRADGSWGARPESCACPAEKRTPPCEAERVLPHLRALGDDDPRTRERAERELRAIGEAALDHLKACAEDPDPEIRGRCIALARRIEFGGPDGGDPERTGLALLAFLGAGFSHLSKDRFDGLCFGDVVRKGLLWLMDRQKSLGAFHPGDPAADAVAALALAEAYGMTSSDVLKDPAQQGIARVARLVPSDARGMIWKGMALKSAELGDLETPRDAAREICKRVRKQKGDAAVAGTTILSIFVHKRKDDARLKEVGALDPATIGTEALYFGTLATFQYDGPGGPMWKGWNASLKKRMLPLQRTKKGECERGSWAASTHRERLRESAQAALMFEQYYAYPAVFTGK